MTSGRTRYWGYARGIGQYIRLMPKITYDPASDAMYIEVRALPSVRTVEKAENVMVDFGEDGGVVGFDIQEARRKARLIGELAMRLKGPLDVTVYGADDVGLDELQVDEVLATSP